jgi:hypothetical protein
MPSYGPGTMPYRDWFCSAEGGPLPRAARGNPGQTPGPDNPGQSFSPRNMACYDDLAILWIRKNPERKI